MRRLLQAIKNLHRHHYREGFDDSGCFGECCVCGKRIGLVSRRQLRRYLDAEEFTRKVAVLALKKGFRLNKINFSDDREASE